MLRGNDSHDGELAVDPHQWPWCYAEVEVVRKRGADYWSTTRAASHFGGTEADNMALFCSVRDLGVKRIITTSIEHHAVGHPVLSAVKWRLLPLRK